MTESQRNLLILVAIAVIGVMFSGTFNSGASILSDLLNIAFTVMIVAVVVMVYRRHSGTISQLPTVPRLVLQGSVFALAAIVITGTLQFNGHLPEPFGWASQSPVAFYGSIFALAFAIWWAWQQRVSRW